MMGSSLCHKLGLIVLCLAVCVFAGCGGGADPAAIGKEWKAANEEYQKATKEEDKKAAKTKVDAAQAKFDKLTDDQKKEAIKTKS